MMKNEGKFTPPPIEPGKYIHVKTQKSYEVLGVACDSETLEWVVIYKPLYEHDGMPDVWVRPHKMFFEKVSIGGIMRQRFEKVDNKNTP